MPAIKLRVYLDTSVFSAYDDERLPERRAATQEFWKRRNDLDLSSSEVAREEISQTPDAALRERLLSLLDETTVHPVSEDMRELARDYTRAGIFGPRVFNDALHVAAAILTRQDVLLSWNFRHLVNRRSRAQINELSVLQGLPTIEIVTPSEL